MSAAQPAKTLEERVAALEAKPAKDFWDKFAAMSGVVSGILLALLGWYISHSLNRSLQERQFQFSSAKDMQELLGRINNADTPPDDKVSTALVLANYGKYAVAPLISQLQGGEPSRSVAAETGLRTIAQSDPEPTCRALILVIANRTQIYTWQAQRSAVRVLRDTECRQAVPALREYAALTGDLARFRDTVHADSPPTAESAELIKAELDRTLAVLAQ